MDYIVETSQLTKQFANKCAVNKVSMHIEKGDIYGFIGKNGAGKTTTMKLLLGLITPTDGTMKLFGSEDLENRRRKIGSLIEAPGLYKNCSAYENMKRFSLLYRGNDQEIRELLELVGLSKTGKRQAGNFSLGMRQRLGIAIAMLGNPELLILDEPINGLDPAGIKDIRDCILRLNKERNVTFLISSHLLDELSKITTRYGIVNNGCLLEEISANELELRCTKGLLIRTSDVHMAVELLKGQGLLERYEIKGQDLYLYSNLGQAAYINRLLVSSGIDVYELAMNNAGFEDYFIERIGK